MKKRILSLLLAFAMAATLAPATALVGTSVSKALVDTTIGDSSKLQKDAGVTALTFERGSSAWVSGLTYTITNSDVDDNSPDNGDESHKLKISFDGDLNEEWFAVTNGSTNVDAADWVGKSITVAAQASVVITVKPVASGAAATDGTVGKLKFIEEGKTTGSSVDIKISAASNNTSFSKNGATATFDKSISVGGQSGTTDLDKITVYIDKEADSFSFDVTNGDTLSDASMSVAKGSGSQPANGNLSFKKSYDKDKKVVTFTANNLKNLAAGTYIFDMTLDGNNTDSASQIKFFVGYKFKVSLNPNGGVVNDGNFPDKDNSGNYYAWSTQYIKSWDSKRNPVYASTITLPSEAVTARAGHILTGWRSTKTYSPGETIDVSKTETFTAVWTPEKAIDLVLNGSSDNAVTSEGARGSDSISVKVGDTIPSNFFTRIGHTFLGWTNVYQKSVTTDGNEGGYVRYPNGAAVNEKLLSEANYWGNGATLYAVWDAITYEIKFDANVPSDSKLSIYNQDKDPIKKTWDDGKVALTDRKMANTFSVNNYHWTGWALDKEGYNTVTSYEDLTLNPEGKLSVTLYAQWQPGNSIVVYEDDYEATNNDVYRVIEDDTMLFNGSIQPRSGYTVEKFTFKDGVSVAGGIEYDENGLVAVYPVYESPDKWNIIYDTDQGTTGVSTKSVEINEITVNTGNVAFPSLDGLADTYKLVGWDIVGVTDSAGLGLTGSFNAASVIKLGEDADPTLRYTLTFKAKFIPYAKDAKVGSTAASTDFDSNAHIFRYGTTLAYIEKQLSKEAELFSDNPGTALITDGVERVTATLNPSTYVSMPGEKSNTDYTVSTVNVYPNSAKVGNSKRWTVTKYNELVSTDPSVANPITFSVYRKTDTDNKYKTTTLTKDDIVAKSISSAKEINLPLRANGADAIYEAVYGGFSATISADDSTKYTFNYDNIKASDGIVLFYKTAACNAQDILESADEIDAYIKTNDKIYAKYVYADIQTNIDYEDDDAYYELTVGKNTKILLPGGLQSQVVKINFTDKPYTENKTDEEKKEEEVTEAVAKAQTLLDQGVVVRLYYAKTSTHYYCSKIDEIEALIRVGCTVESNRSFRFSPIQTPVYTEPIYRLSTPGKGYIYAFESEKNAIIKNTPAGLWTVNAGGNPIFYVNMDSKNPTMYRMYNKVLGTLLYSPKDERDTLMKYPNIWEDQTTEFNMWRSPAN